MATLNVSLPDPMREWIDAQVRGGEYANASDYIRDLIRHDQRQREALKLALIEAEQSGVSTRQVGDIVAAAEARLDQG
ncbi:MAG: type II toxin-antitoxin system ParD family antitoxin [Geminicoccaceae bacterium]